MKNSIMPEYGSISEIKQALDNELHALKALNENELDAAVAVRLQKIECLYWQLIINLDGIDRFYTFKLWEQEISDGGYFNKIDDELRLRYFGDQDQQSLQACCSSLNRCLSSLSLYLSSLDVLLGRIKNSEDESYLLARHVPPRARSRSVGDLLDGSNSGAVSVGPRTERAFSEPLLDLSGWNRKRFIDNDCYSFFRAVCSASAHVLNIKNLEMNLLLLSVKRMIKFLCDTVAIFQKIVIKKINKESKFYFPVWFFSNDGIMCLCRAQELKDILQAFTQQTEHLRDTHADMLAHTQHQMAAESQAVTFLVNAHTHKGVARYVYDDNAAQQVQDKKPASPQEKKFCEILFGEDVFAAVKAFILEMMEQDDNKSALVVEFKNNTIEILLEKTGLVLTMPLPNSAQKFFASFDVTNFENKTNARATLPSFKPLPKPPKSKLVQFFTSRNKPRTVFSPRDAAAQHAQSGVKNRTL